MKENKPVPGYEGLYTIYEDGSLFSHISGSFMKPQNNGPYIQYVLTKEKKHRYFKAHQLVAMAWLPAPLKRIIHLDGNPHNNHHSNLCFQSRSSISIKGRKEDWSQISPRPPIKTNIDARSKPITITTNSQSVTYPSIYAACKSLNISRNKLYTIKSHPNWNYPIKIS